MIDLLIGGAVAAGAAYLLGSEINKHRTPRIEKINALQAELEAVHERTSNAIVEHVDTEHRLLRSLASRLQSRAQVLAASDVVSAHVDPDVVTALALTSSLAADAHHQLAKAAA